MKVFAYLRTFENEMKTSDGVEDQREAIEAFVQDHNLDETIEIAEWYEDSYAETESIPPGFTAMLGALGDEELAPITDHPDNVRVLVAGGPGKHSCVIPSWGMTKSVTLPITP